MISESLGRRIGALSGMVFFVLIMVASGMLPSDPGPDDAAGTILKAYRDADSALLGVFLNGIAAIPLLWFAATLRDLLGRAEGGAMRISSIVLASAVGASVFGVLSGVIHGAVWSRVDQADSVNDDVAAMLYVLAGASLSAFFLFAGAMAWATSVTALRHGGLPAWAGWLSGALGVLMIVGAYDVTLSEGLGFLGLIGMALFFIIIPIVTFIGVRRDVAAAN